MARLRKFESSAGSEHFRAILSTPAGDLLSECVRAGGHPFVMGGAVRDVVAQELTSWPARPSRDVDVGVAGLRRERFTGIMKAYKGKRNHYGGYRFCSNNGPSWDVWRIEDTVGLKGSQEAKSVENVLRSFVLDCNAIAYDILQDCFLDLSARASILRAELSLIRGAILHDEPIFAAKALVCRFTLPMNLSPILTRFVGAHLTRSSLKHELSKYATTSHMINTGVLESVILDDSCRFDNKDRRLT